MAMNCRVAKLPLDSDWRLIDAAARQSWLVCVCAAEGALIDPICWYKPAWMHFVCLFQS